MRSIGIELFGLVIGAAVWAWTSPAVARTQVVGDVGIEVVFESEWYAPGEIIPMYVSLHNRSGDVLEIPHEVRVNESALRVKVQGEQADLEDSAGLRGSEPGTIVSRYNSTGVGYVPADGHALIEVDATNLVSMEFGRKYFVEVSLVYRVVDPPEGGGNRRLEFGSTLTGEAQGSAWSVARASVVSIGVNPLTKAEDIAALEALVGDKLSTQSIRETKDLNDRFDPEVLRMHAVGMGASGRASFRASHDGGWACVHVRYLGFVADLGAISRRKGKVNPAEIVRLVGNCDLANFADDALGEAIKLWSTRRHANQDEFLVFKGLIDELMASYPWSGTGLRAQALGWVEAAQSAR